ncbi:MAG: hypothetical protein H6742_09130 [Alphaproteobacteria bacterium]|nr:hypothetical protein [Alphaproteobacteria bacterium]
MRHLLASSLSLLAACAPARTLDGDDGGAGADTGDPPGTTLGDVPDPAPWVELLDVDDDTLGGLGLQIRTYAITPEHEPAYSDTDGDPPEFRVIVPADLDPAGEQLPVLLWLHGGVAATPDDPDSAHLCTYDGTVALARDTLPDSPYLSAWLAADRRMAVMPHSTWCDLWAGLGPDDPVDASHLSQVHVRAVMQAVSRGLDGARGNRHEVAVWGRSVGAVGTFVTAVGLEERGYGVQGIVADSGPVALAELGTEGELPATWLDAWFGGPPTDDEGMPSEWFDNYERVDPVQLVDAGRVHAPVMVAWNQWDLLTDSRHGPLLWDALDRHHRPRGIPAFGMDFDRHSPGDKFHTQLTGSLLANVAGTAAATDAAAGRALLYVEADAHCPTLPDAACEAVQDADEALTLVRMVGDDAVVASEPDVALFHQPLDPGLPRDQPVRLRLALDTPWLGQGQTGKVLSIELLAGDQVRWAGKVLAQDLHPPSATPPTAAQLYDHVAGLTLKLPADALADADSIRITTSGLTPVRLDGLWFSWRPAG